MSFNIVSRDCNGFSRLSLRYHFIKLSCQMFCTDLMPGGPDAGAWPVPSPTHNSGCPVLLVFFARGRGFWLTFWQPAAAQEGTPAPTLVQQPCVASLPSRNMTPSQCQEVFLLDRRSFLSGTSGLAAALALPGRLFAQLQSAPAALPDSALYSRDQDAYWAELRKQFLIPSDEIYLNNGTVGSSPAPVLRAIFDGYTQTEKMDQADPEDYPIWGYAAWNQFRDPLAAFVGCKRDELALVRNATEANSYIANGIEMNAGDEVLMTDQEHPGGLQPWRLRAKRYGVVIKTVTLPKPVKDASQVLNLFNDAITPRTRVIFFSHITTVTGVVLPGQGTVRAGALEEYLVGSRRSARDRHDAS